MEITGAVDAEFWARLGVEAHPVAPLPGEAWLREHSLEQLVDFLNEREETITRMREDPYRHGWEPTTWKILDALLGFDWIDAAWALQVRRQLLSQDEPLLVLLLNGGNRGSKSEWAASRVVRVLMRKDKRKAWCFHQSEQMSVKYQQELLWKYLPAEYKSIKGIRTAKTYIAYKQQTGFSDNSFVLPNGSSNEFRNYEQDRKNIEGGELDIVWCDELVPASWVKTLRARVATRMGRLILTFTPVDGYTPTVKGFLDLATTTAETIAFVLPKDGGAGRPDLAIAGQDMDRLLAEPLGCGQPPVPEGRQFERVPRCMRCDDRTSGVFFFHSWDNPFGNPSQLYSLYEKATGSEIKMRLYGVADKQVSARLPKFGAAHIITAAQVPKDRGTVYHKVDPCSGRNWAMIWVRVVRQPVGLVYYVFREWPCPGKYIPGVGDPGVWAEPGNKHDGVQGPAQRPWGFGLRDYAAEIARVEGQPNRYIAAEAGVPTKFDRWDREDPAPRVRGRIRGENAETYERWMDSRYGNSPTPTTEGTTTLIEQSENVGLFFLATSGKNIDEGTELLNDAMSYDTARPVGPDNMPRFFVVEDCANVIFALRNWTGMDGQKGACKDFVDLCRYTMLDDHEDWTEDRSERGAA